MFKICYRYANNIDEAEDLLSEAFVIIFTKLNTYKFKGSFEGWIKRITVNTSLNKIRARKNNFLERIEDDNHNYLEDLSPSILDQFANDDLLEIVRQLPPSYRVVFNLYAVEGYTHKEISDELNISVGTSKSNLFAARKELKLRINGSIKKKEVKKQSFLGKKLITV